MINRCPGRNRADVARLPSEMSVPAWRRSIDGFIADVPEGDPGVVPGGTHPDEPREHPLRNTPREPTPRAPPGTPPGASTRRNI
jgi:hypothetical protein